MILSLNYFKKLNNRLKKISASIVIFFASLSLFGQNIKSIVTDPNGNPVGDCYIILEDTDTNKIVDYSSPNNKGEWVLHRH